MDAVADTPPPAGATTLAPAQVAKAWAAAKDFEAMALGEMLKPMFSTVDTAHGPFGGGEGEAAWQPMLTEAMAKNIARHGGLGIAAPVFTQMLRQQEQVDAAGFAPRAVRPAAKRKSEPPP